MLVTFIALALVPMLILGLLLTYRTEKLFSERIGQEMRVEVVTGADTITVYLAGAGRDVLSLARFVQRRMARGMNAEELQVITEEFVSTIAAEGAYFQVRFLNAEGMEVIRVNNQGGQPVVVPPQGLQYKGDSDYFREAMKLPVGEVYLSAVDFNIEHGRVEEPRRLVTRLATPVADHAGRVLGLVVVNVFAEKIFGFLEKLRSVPEIRTLLLDEKRHFLELRRDGEQSRLHTGSVKELEKPVGQALVMGDAAGARIVAAGDYLLAVAPVSPGGGRNWQLAKIYPRSMLLADLTRLHWTFVFLAAPSVLLAAAAALFVARSFSEPIRRLSRFSEDIARGDYDQRLLLSSDDELGKLVDSLNSMAASLAESRDRLLAVNRSLQAEVARQSRTRAELQRSNQELEQFAYVASHDLQEPLRMVTSFVQLLARRYQGQLDEKAAEYIAFAVDGVARMQLLIDGLLTYSRVARGAEFGRIEMNEVFAEAVANLSISIDEHQASVTQDDLPAVSGDRTQLLQLLQNLIINALKYRRPEESPRVHVSAFRDEDRWAFAVRDNGIGIEQQYFEKIFLIFQRLHTREEHAGTGIGLALCKRIVERHGGRIWVESVPGSGSNFFFTLSDGETL
jgi:signal transduction histidine kinase